MVVNFTSGMDLSARVSARSCNWRRMAGIRSNRTSPPRVVRRCGIVRDMNSPKLLPRVVEGESQNQPEQNPAREIVEARHRAEILPVQPDRQHRGEEEQ